MKEFVKKVLACKDNKELEEFLKKVKKLAKFAKKVKESENLSQGY